MTDTTIKITIEHVGMKWTAEIPEDGYADLSQLDVTIEQVAHVLGRIWHPNVVRDFLVEYAEELSKREK